MKKKEEVITILVRRLYLVGNMHGLYVNDIIMQSE
jgi:hypothetical protein